MQNSTLMYHIAKDSGKLCPIADCWLNPDLFQNRTKTVRRIAGTQQITLVAILIQQGRFDSMKAIQPIPSRRLTILFWSPGHSTDTDSGRTGPLNDGLA